MSLETRIRDMATSIATEINTIRTERGALASLSTTEQASIVGAINELKTAIDGISSASINDAATATDSAWSSTKIAAEIQTAKDDLVNGAPGALDTLNEIATALTDNDSDISGILTSLSNRVRTDTAAQGLNATQQGNARTNIGAQSAADVGDTDRDFAADFTGGLS